MNTDRRSSSLFANRILIGAALLLVLVLAVFFAYNAGSGLPFVSTYDIDVQAPDAAGLIVGNEVTIGGSRVGYVSAITSGSLASGRAIAVLHLKLDRSLGRLPADSTDLIRPVSPLGLKYLEITRGSSGRLLGPGATIPLSHTSRPVEIDDVFNMFTARTRAAAQVNLDEVGTGFAGRGADLNATLSGLGPLVRRLEPVTSQILAPQTQWAQLFVRLERAARAVAPVAGHDAHLFEAIDATFAPLARQTNGLKASIAGGPAALRTATVQLPAEARFVDDATGLLARLRPAFTNLATAATQLAPAETAGIPALRASPQLNARLVRTLDALNAFTHASSTLPGLELLTDFAGLLAPIASYLEPAQTRCNYLALFFRNLASSLSESTAVGSELNVQPLSLPQLPGSEAGPSSRPADGPSASSISGLTLAQRSLVIDSYLHANAYPNTAAPGQPVVCAAGNEDYIPGRIELGNPALTQRTTDSTSRVLP